jgi:hypothetical protein
MAGPASAHTPKVNAFCSNDNQPTLTVDLSAYSASSNKHKNTVTVTEDDGANKVTLLATTNFSTTFNQTFNSKSTPSTGSADQAHTYSVAITAWDDPTGKNGWTKTLPASSPKCVETPPPPSSTTNSPPPTTTTTAPPTTGSSSVSPTTATTTSGAVAAPTTTNGPGGGLAYTGVSTALPLGIAGALVVAGGGLLFWIRMSAKRKTS